MIPISVQSEFRPMTLVISALELDSKATLDKISYVFRGNLQAQLRAGLQSNSASFSSVCKDLGLLIKLYVHGPTVDGEWVCRHIAHTTESLRVHSACSADTGSLCKAGMLMQKQACRI